MWALTDEQVAVREEVRRLALAEVRPRAARLDEDAVAAELFELLARSGVIALAVEPEYGGRWIDHLAWSVAVEELAKVSGTASLMAAYVRLVALPILLAGTEDQKHRYLPGLAAGEMLGSYALTEPEAGSDPASLTTRADRRRDGWVLNGEKRFIGNAGASDVLVVFARTGAPGAGGISALLVPGGAPGISATPLPTMGLTGWRLGTLRFEDVKVQGDALLGAEGEGFKLAMRVFDLSRPGVAAQAVGLGQGALDLALDYALRRHTFGRPLVEHGAVLDRLAGMDADLAAARALGFQASAAADAGAPDLSRLAAASKLVAADTAMRVTTDALQILGGNGYLSAFPAERMMRDAKVCQIYEGASEIQRLVIGRLLVREARDREPVWPDALPERTVRSEA